MNMGEWDKEAKTMTNKDRKKMISALVTLDRWPAFKREYGWTGYGTLTYILKVAEQNAEREAEREVNKP